MRIGYASFLQRILRPQNPRTTNLRLTARDFSRRQRLCVGIQDAQNDPTPERGEKADNGIPAKTLEYKKKQCVVVASARVS